MKKFLIFTIAAMGLLNASQATKRVNEMKEEHVKMLLENIILISPIKVSIDKFNFNETQTLNSIHDVEVFSEYIDKNGLDGVKIEVELAVGPKPIPLII